ncbi:unnamed protein product [Hermetia illucens]|uniref:Uncharacterized protein n=1 Tax=Hermetia illucens TaxID=343691 RepID=A0A7R8UXL7_HERIL|nr:unnamed protein product [Hermetia illucens]
MPIAGGEPVLSPVESTNSQPEAHTSGINTAGDSDSGREEVISEDISIHTPSSDHYAKASPPDCTQKLHLAVGSLAIR